MKRDQGLIKWILLIVIAVIILGYYGFSIRAALESPVTRDNLNVLQDIAIKIWQYVLRAPVVFVWEHILLPLIHKITG